LFFFVARGKGRAGLLAGSLASTCSRSPARFFPEFPADQTPLITCPVLLTLKRFLFENCGSLFAICLEGELGAGQIALE
jgi:hypothetical protein